MLTVSASEFQKQPGKYQDPALREPVMVTSHGRERLVLLPVAEYHRLRQLDRQAVRAQDLSAGELATIAAARVPDRFKGLDQELED